VAYHCNNDAFIRLTKWIDVVVIGLLGSGIGPNLAFHCNCMVFYAMMGKTQPSHSNSSNNTVIISTGLALQTKRLTAAQLIVMKIVCEGPHIVECINTLIDWGETSIAHRPVALLP